MRSLVRLIFTLLVLVLPCFGEKIKIGVPLALTGDLAPMGMDARDAILFANERLGEDRYELVVEDEKCSGGEAANIAHKLINIDRVRYVVGLSCNTALLSSAPLYEKAGIAVISSSATSGDVLDVGEQIFRPFPPDHYGARLLYGYVSSRHKKVGVLTEEEEYAVLLERTFAAENDRTRQIEAVYEQFPRGGREFRTLLARLMAKNPDALFLNASGEGTFIPLMKQLRELRINVPLYGEFVPGSRVVLQALGDQMEGVRFVDLPDARFAASEEGKALLNNLEQKYGPARSISLVRPISYEAFRIMDEAIRSGLPVNEYIKGRSFKSPLLGEFRFDAHNVVEGISFQMKEIRGGRPVVIQD